MSEDEDDGFPDFSNDPTCTGIYVITTARVTCPKCEKKNYVDLGDMSDQTAPDVEAVKCWSCKTVAWLDVEVREFARYSHESLDCAYDANGREYP